MTVKPSVRLMETFYRIDPGQFHYLKFILEGYDNLAVLSSVSGRTGVVRIRCSSESLSDLIVLMNHLAPIISRKRLV